jgi:hypothetical protein
MFVHILHNFKGSQYAFSVVASAPSLGAVIGFHPCLHAERQVGCKADSRYETFPDTPAYPFTLTCVRRAQTKTSGVCTWVASRTHCV